MTPWSGGAFGVYGGYVWSAVGLFVLVVLANVWAARAAYRTARERARRGLERGAQGG